MNTQRLTEQASELEASLAKLPAFRAQLAGNKIDKDSNLALYVSLKELKREIARVSGGGFSPHEAERLGLIDEPEPKPERVQSPELARLAGELEAARAAHREAAGLYQSCITDEMANPSAKSYVTPGGELVTSARRNPDESRRKLEIAKGLMNQAEEGLQKALVAFNTRQDHEQRRRVADEHQRRQDEQKRRRQEAEQRRTQSFTADALKFFGLKVS